MRWQTAIVERIEKRTPLLSSFFFRLSRPFAFKPGQHVSVRLTAPDGYTAQRSYSIASAPTAGPSETVELAIERLDDGEVSPFFHDVAAVGDAIEIGGPIGGHFVWIPEDGAALFIAGGSGIVPFVSMLRYRAALRAAVPVTLLVSARRLADLAYHDELAELARADPRFRIMATLTREPGRPPIRSGRVDAALIAEIVAATASDPLRQVMICGSNPFVETAAQGALAAGVPPGLVKTERYGV